MSWFDWLKGMEWNQSMFLIGWMECLWAHCKWNEFAFFFSFISLRKASKASEAKRVKRRSQQRERKEKIKRRAARPSAAPKPTNEEMKFNLTLWGWMEWMNLWVMGRSPSAPHHSISSNLSIWFHFGCSASSLFLCCNARKEDKQPHQSNLFNKSTLSLIINWFHKEEGINTSWERRWNEFGGVFGEKKRRLAHNQSQMNWYESPNTPKIKQRENMKIE